jgi:hypothetical protein
VFDLADLPAPLLFDVIYALVAEDTKEAQEHRDKLDGVLDQKSVGIPDRATWGKLPHHQRAMQAAATA